MEMLFQTMKLFSCFTEKALHDARYTVISTESV